MTARLRYPLRGGIALPLLLVLAVPATATAARGECRVDACAARMLVSPEVGVFQSEQSFDLDRENVVVNLAVGEERLRTVDREGRFGCRRLMRGPGVQAEVEVCGEGPLEVAAWRTWGGSVAMRIVYRARPRARHGVKGISASSDGGGGVSSPSSGGVGSPRR